MSGFDCSGGAGVGAAAHVARALRACGYLNVYTSVPSVLVCCEPIVVRQHEWAEQARFDDGSVRGTERVRVYVCMDSEADAESTALSICRDLYLADWAGVVTLVKEKLGMDAVRIVDVQTGAPDDLGRDGSGRWVRAVDVVCAVVRGGSDGDV